MALSKLQSDILRLLAKNRSESSYFAGGLMLNKDWQRRSDDIGIFHDTDEEVTESAKADLALLEAARFKTHRDFIIYGCVDATVSREGESTIIQWFAETKLRFFPLVRDQEWGARLHQADLAINKVLAAAGRSKARDIADLVAIGRDPPACIVDSGGGVCSREGLAGRMVSRLHSGRIAPADGVGRPVRVSAPPELTGILAVDAAGVPVEISDSNRADAILRKPTAEPEVMPAPADFNAVGWTPDRP